MEMERDFSLIVMTATSKMETDATRTVRLRRAGLAKVDQPLNQAIALQQPLPELIVH